MNIINIIKNWFKKEESDFAERLIEEIKEEREKRKQESEEILERLSKEGVE